MTFTSQIEYGTGRAPLSVVTADFNGDHKEDLATANELSGTVSVLLGNGDGTFQTHEDLAVGNYPYAVTAADLRGDGNMDLVVANYGYNVIGGAGTVSVLLGNGNGTFQAQHQYAVGNEPEAVTIADVNGDGKPDIIVANYADNTLSILLGNGNGTFQAPQTVVVGNGPRSVFAADLNGDGKMDLVTANYADNTVSVLLGNGNGTFKAPQTLAVGCGPRSVIAADFNGDGKLDLAVANQSSNTVSVLLGNGNGTFHAATSIPVDYAPRAVIAADINGDGVTDLATANYASQTISVLVGNGDGTFQSEQTFATGYSPIALAAADFNGDGDLDVVAANTEDDAVSVLLNTTNSQTQTTPTITSARSATFATSLSNTFTITTTASPTAVLSEIGTLPAGITFHDNGNGTGTLSGMPTGAVGSYTLTLSASNGIGSAAMQTFTLNVGQVPVITSVNHAGFTTGTAGTFTITTTGFPAPGFTINGTLPSGVGLHDDGNGTALLEGTPTVSGTYVVTLGASNGVNPAAFQVFTLTVGSAPAITSANHATFTTGTVGTFAISTSGFPAPAITETGALPSGLTFTTFANGTGTVTGTPAALTGGTYLLTLSASNGIGTAASQVFTLTIDQAPAITSANHVTFTVGTAGTLAVTSSGFPLATLSEIGTLPAGITFSPNGNGTATLAGAAGAATGGTYVLTFTANNGVGAAASQVFTLTVDQAPAITSANAATFTTATVGTFNVTATGFPAATLSETGALPTGLSFNTATGALTGTPGAAMGGTYHLTFSANNGVGSIASQTFTLTVDQAPAITSGNSTTFTAGAAGTLTVTTSGYPLATLSETGALPTGVTFTANANGTATLAGTAGAGAGGTYILTLSAANGVGAAATQTFTLTIGQSPVFTSANQATFTVGSAGTFSVASTGFPTPAITELGTLPSGITFTANSNGSATLAGTPAAGTGGTYTLTLQAKNGGTTVSQIFTLTVDQAPAITSANHSTFTTGASGAMTVTTSGYPIAALTETGSLPSGVSFQDNGNGTATITGTPAAATGGADVITLSASNGVGSATNQVFTLTVDQAPAITSGNSVTFTTGTAGTTLVTTTGFPAATLSESGVLPSGVTFTSNANGAATLAGTPGAATGGTYVLTISASNGVGVAASQVFTLTVNQAPAMTSANHVTFTTGAAGTLAISSSGFPLASLSETGVLPSGITFTANGNGAATLAGTAGAGTGGTYVLTISAANGVGTAASQVFTLTVDQAPAITSGNSATFTTAAAGTLTVTTTGYPLATLSETGSLPTGVSFTANANGTATLAGTPSVGGTYLLTISASNGVGAAASQVFTLTVDAAPAITSANHATFTTGAAGTMTVTTTGFPTSALSESGVLPTGVIFTASANGSATLTGTAAAGTGGTYLLTFSATNGVGTAASQMFTLTVDQAPAITSGNSTTFTTGTAGTLTVTTTGFPSAVLTETGAMPTGVTFISNGNGNATLAGTPSVGGTYLLTISASNGVGVAASQVFTLTVDAAPAITSANQASFATGSAGTFNVSATGFPAAALTETGILPSGIIFTANSNGTATLTGTPTASGTFSLTFSASNGVGSAASQVFTLTVGQASAITSANQTTFTTGSAGALTVTTTGFPTSALSETGTLPANITFLDNGNGTGTLSGTPAAGTGGTYALTISASNGVGAAATQVFTLTVDQAPAITTANTATFTTGSAGTFTIAATGFPIATLTETGTLPSGVTFTPKANGTATLTGTPAAGTGGTYVLTYSAANGVGTAASQVFTLTVDQAASISSLNHATFTVGSSGTFTVTASGVPTATLTETGALPGGVTFTANGNGTASLTGTPAGATGGTYLITFSAANGVGTAGTQVFTLTVDQAPAISTANHATFTTAAAGTFTVTSSGFPTAAISETGALPTGVTLHDNGNGTATLAGTPGAATGGTYLFTLSASNGVGTAASQVFTLSVDFAAAISSANHATFTVATPGTFTVTSTGLPTAGLTETGTLPSGVSFHDNGNGTATLAGAPAGATGGTYLITFSAANGVGTAGTQVFTLTVDQSPAITSANQATFAAGSAGTFGITTTGFPTSSFTETGSLPSGVGLHDNGNGTANITGTPAAGTIGTYVLTLSANNGVGTAASQVFTLTVDQAPVITSANHATFTAGSAATFTVTSTALPAAALTETGALPGGVTLHDNGNGTATLAGNPAAGGIYVFTLSASNGIGSTGTQIFTLSVDQSPAISSGNQTTLASGALGSFAVTTTGFPTAGLSETGALPSGVTLHDNGNGTATLGGTPAAGSGGTYIITLSASNGIGSATSQVFTLTVDQPAAVSSANRTTFTSGAAATFTVTSSGNPTASLTETGALPAAVTFAAGANGTATLSGTPLAGSGGTYLFTFSAANGVGVAGNQIFTLTVDDAPAISSSDSAGFTTGTAGSFTVTTTGFPAAALSESGALPAGITFQDNGDGTATLGGRAAATAGGTYLLTISAGNGVGSPASQVFTITVDQAPAITSAASATFTTAAAGTFAVTTTGSPTSAITETGTLPSGVSFTDNGDGTASLSGTPDAGTGGTYTLTLQAANGSGSAATQVFTLTVDDAPAFVSDDTTTFTAGSAGTFTVATSGFPTAALSESGALPAGVRFKDNGDGTATLSGTPTSASGGTFTLTLSASNGVGSAATQIFTLDVVQMSKITSANHATFTVGAAGSFTITSTGSPTAALSESGTLPAGITFTDNGDGTATLAGDATSGAGGAYSLTLTADNGVGGSVNQTFTITVHEAPAITSGTAVTFTTVAAGTFTVTTTGFPAATLSEAGALPSGVHFKSNGDGTATLSGAPAQGTDKTYSLVISATNGVGVKAIQTFTLTVQQPSAITSLTHATFTTGVSGSFTVTTSGLPAGALTESGALPGGVTFTDNGDGAATLAGTPDAASGAAYVLTLSADNGVGAPGTQVFTLNVDQPPAITSGNAVTFTTVAAGTFTVTTTGFPAAALTEAGALPSGLHFKSNGDGTATLSGTPALGTDKTYSFVISAGNGVGAKATQAFILTVDQPSAITSVNHAIFTTGTAGSFTIKTSGLPVGTLGETGTLPGGITFTDNGDGTATLSGTPNAGIGAAYVLTLSADNGVGSPAAQVFTLNVDQPPAITNATAVTFTTVSAGTFTFTTTGFPAAKFTEAGALPRGVHFHSNGDGTATLSGLPALGTDKTYKLAVTATNGVGVKATQTFTLTVQQPSAIISLNHATFTPGIANTFTVKTTGLPVGALSETGALPDGVSFTDNGNGTATLAGDPATGGIYVLTLAATNGIGTPAAQTFTLNVKGAPTFTSGAFLTLIAGLEGDFTITTSSSPVATITESGALPAGIQFQNNGDGTADLSGAPVDGSGGVYIVTLTASNGAGSTTTQNLSLTIDQPAAFTSAAQTTFTTGQAGTFTVTTSGLPAGVFTEAGALPSGVSFTDNGDGTATLAGTPGSGTAGAYALTLGMDNGLGDPATQVFTLTVD